jgi:hypothetical protein
VLLLVIDQMILSFITSKKDHAQIKLHERNEFILFPLIQIKASQFHLPFQKLLPLYGFQVLLRND